MQNLENVKFGRSYRAEFEIGKRNNGKLEAEEKLTISYPFTLVLNIDSGVNNSSNTGAFQFYNLSRQDRAKLWIDEYNNGKKYIKMDLYAGYQEVMPLVFSGFFSKCTSYRQSGAVDWITEISAFDGGELFRYGYVNACVHKDTKLVDLLQYMLEGYGLKPGYITDDIPPLPKNRTFIGQTMDILGREYGGYDIFVEDNELHILGPNDVKPGDIQIISADTGLLGSPRRGNLYTEIDMIFEPRLKNRQAVSLYSQDLPEFNNLHEVVQVKHKGIISPAICGTLITTATLSLFATDEPKLLKKAAPSTYGGTPTTGPWIKPVKGRVSSPYGWRIHPITKKRYFHYGIDIAASLNTPIVAPANGRVIFRGYEGVNGNKIKIDHGMINGKRVTSTYIHLNKILVNQGQTVYKGQEIGLVGSTGKYPDGRNSSTGPHLHLSIYEQAPNEKKAQPVNPAKYIGNY